MTPTNRQLVIRDFELFVSSGVQEIPQAVYDRDNRAAGEFRVVRASETDELEAGQDFPYESLGSVVIDSITGNIASK